MPHSLAELAQRTGATLRGDDVLVSRVATLESAESGAIAFLANPKYRPQLASTRASAVIVAPDMTADTVLPALVDPNPYAVFAKVAAILHPRAAVAAGIHPSAIVDSTAKVAATAAIGALAAIGAGAVVGERACIGAGSVIGAGASIGDDTVLHARVTIYEHCVVGPRSVLHSGAVIGADGFGMAEEGGQWLKIPQVGRVVIGADVEIGANTTIDRGAIDDTVIEDDVKLDNQIQIGHNCRIGRHTAIAGCVGIAGSTRIGRNCKIGGAAYINGHIEICDDVMLGGGTGVYRSITAPGIYSGSNLELPHAQWQHVQTALRKLPELLRRVRRLEQGGAARAESAPDKTGGKSMNAADDGRMDIDEIMRYLPHRYPFLLVDRVTSIEANKSIRGIKNVTMNEPYFGGHFPHYAVMPAVLVIEALAQLASILAWKMSGRTPGDGTIIFFAGIDNARFRRQVRPGDQLMLESEAQRLVRGVGKFDVRAKVDGEIVAEASLLAAMRMPDIDAKGG